MVVEVVPAHIRSGTIGTFLFLMNNVGIHNISMTFDLGRITTQISGGWEPADAGGAPGEEPRPGPPLGAVHHVARPPHRLRAPLPGVEPPLAGRRAQGQETLLRLNIKDIYWTD